KAVFVNKHYISYFLYSIPSGGRISTLPAPTSLQLVLRTVPADSV
ncbi:unnamed protein product, partial [Schistosoma curassoni]|uniref:Uncharacterized protein n=1 Tax=Schistosoma curassoni TaxID=6186 RepID=A0A183KKT1_9TREM